MVILHLSPKHESIADKVLQTSSRMPVMQVTQPTPLEPDHVYVISPNQDLTMSDGHLSVKEANRPRGHHVAIDLFFRTLADTHQDKAIGIVLSGTGADGAVGIARIKEQGGVTFVQSPDDAEYDNMPRSAIGLAGGLLVSAAMIAGRRAVTIAEQTNHLATSAAFGWGYGLLRPHVRLPATVIGALYGSALYAINIVGIAPRIGMTRGESREPIGVSGQRLAMHVLFGVATATIAESLMKRSRH